MSEENGKFRILGVDDNEFIRLIVHETLAGHGFDVVTVQSGEEGINYLRENGMPHLALVDINMPLGIDGLEFCEIVHEFSDLPIIMLTAVDEEQTIIQAIEHHAEDYIVKPFNPGELIARVRRVLNRLGHFAYPLTDPNIIVDENLSINFATQEAIIAGKQTQLTPTEAKLLYVLMRNAGETVTTEYILRRLWPHDTAYEDRLRVYIHRLRRKVETQKSSPRYVASVRGAGYRFLAAGSSE